MEICYQTSQNRLKKELDILCNSMHDLSQQAFYNKQEALWATYLTRALGVSRQEEWEQVQLPNKGKFAKLRPRCQSLEKYLYFPREHFLIMMTGYNTKVSSIAVKIAN